MPSEKKKKMKKKKKKKKMMMMMILDESKTMMCIKDKPNYRRSKQAYLGTRYMIYNYPLDLIFLPPSVYY